MARLRNLPIAVKAFAASSVLLISLALLGAEAVSSLDRTTASLTTTVNAVLGKQTQKEELVDAIRDSHLKLFRYTAWASNGVDDELIAALGADILTANQRLEAQFHAFSDRADLTAMEAEQAALFATAWKKYASAAKDSVEVGSIDPAMATMMLGGSDDDFQAAMLHLQEMANAARSQTQWMVREVSAAAASDGRAIQLGALAAILISLATLLLFARSIVMPVHSVTAAMRRISFGNLDFEPDRTHLDRKDEIGQMVDAIAKFCRRMKRDKELIEKREDELRTQNLRFNAALANMSQGLAMFDREHRLIVSNDRYAEVYRTPPELVRPGTTQETILEHRIAEGTYAGLDPDSYCQSSIEAARSGRPFERSVELKDGRVVAVSHRPMADGGWVSTHEDITERRRAEAKIAFMATHDALTELPNRLLFRQRLDEALSGIADGTAIAVHCLDLDRFKAVNDTLGHPVGDLLLKAVALRLKACISGRETVARLSGDEFAIVQPGIAGAQKAADLAAAIVAAIAEPFELDGHHVSVGTSVGIAWTRDGSAAGEQLLRDADTALYRSKSDGRGLYRFFEQGMDETLQTRRRLEIDLRTALPERQFEVHYQPIVEACTRSVVAFEALLRWHHPERGLVPPNEFIPVAEEIGLIGRVGSWVLRQACHEAAKWPENIRVAVNLSPVQFHDQGLVALVASALAEAGIAPARLELEVTESVLLLESPGTIALLHSLRELGVRIAMDDFGTGYSSLSYLRSFPFDKIKIDRCFIKELPEDGDCGAIVRATIALAQSLGMTTTAEGVETAGQLEFLRLQGCAEAQGFHFSAARPAADIPKLLASWREQEAA